MPTNPSVERLAQSPNSHQSDPLPDFPSIPRYVSAKSSEWQRYDEETKNAWNMLKLKLERMAEIVERLSDTSQ